jgi:hypothetical protein
MLALQQWCQGQNDTNAHLPEPVSSTCPVEDWKVNLIVRPESGPHAVVSVRNLEWPIEDEVFAK